MAEIKLINKFGKMAGWTSVKVEFLGRVIEGISEVEYNDTQDLENVYGAGDKQIGQSEGNYEAKASITLYTEEMRALLDSLPAGVRIQDISFNIKCSFEYGLKFYTDVIANCRIMNNGVAVKQGDKTIATKHDLLTTHIDWNV